MFLFIPMRATEFLNCLMFVKCSPNKSKKNSLIFLIYNNFTAEQLHLEYYVAVSDTIWRNFAPHGAT